MLRMILRMGLGAVLAGAISLVLWGIGGGCDPDCRVYARNNYAFPIVVRHLNNPARNIPDMRLDTVAPGKRQELAQNLALDGDIDNIQIEDAQGKVLDRLNTHSKSVICKQTQPQYVWEVTVGP